MKSTTRMLLMSAALLAAPAAASADAPRPSSPLQRMVRIVESIAPAARTAATTAAATVARPERLQARTGNTKRPSYDGTVACDLAEQVPQAIARDDAE